MKRRILSRASVTAFSYNSYDTKITAILGRIIILNSFYVTTSYVQGDAIPSKLFFPWDVVVTSVLNNSKSNPNTPQFRKNRVDFASLTSFRRTETTNADQMIIFMIH